MRYQPKVSSYQYVRALFENNVSEVRYHEHYQFAHFLTDCKPLVFARRPREP